MRHPRITAIGQCALAPCDPASLAVFRVALGLSLAWFAFETLTTPSLSVDYIQPKIHLTYYGFDWVRPWPGNGMTLHFFVLMISALAFALGLGYRLAAIVMCLTFTHVFLIERSLYNNHYYLVVLLSFLSIFLPLTQGWSVDALRRDAFDQSVPMWTVWLLRFQIGIVYFFGGVAKLDADWLRGQPMRMWLAAKANLPVIGPYLTEEWVVQVFVWGGLVIDLLAVPCLLWSRTRLPMFGLLLVFHLLNSQLFSIGFFPWLMLAATTLFFQPDWPKRWLRMPTVDFASTAQTMSWTRRGRWGAAVIAMYVAIQLLVPLRHFAYPGNPSWTEQGQLFAWRMMLRQKTTAIRFQAFDPASGRHGVLDVRPYLNLRQATQMSRDPDLIIQFAHKLADYHRTRGVRDLEIRVVALASLNGRKAQLLIDPNLDLVRQARGWRTAECVLPLTEPFRYDAWNVPVAKWEQEVLTTRPAMRAVSENLRTALPPAAPLATVERN